MAHRALRPVDLAREHGLSAQAIRNYEHDGILPPATRSETGYRRYTSVHAQALRAFLALRPGFGYQKAVDIMRAAHAGDDDTLFRLVDQGHAALVHERATLDEVTATLATLTAGPSPNERPSAPLRIGELAHQLGMHPASLRKWERAGVLRPHRDGPNGNRLYPPDVVRDARVARQLRRGGYLLAHISAFVERLRDAGGTDALRDLLHQWRDRIARQSRAMLTGGRELDGYLTLLATERAARP